MQPRGYAALFVLLMIPCLWLLARAWARRSPRPVAIWGAGGYLMWLHLLCAVGLLSSVRFESGLAQLTLFTFPFSTLVADEHFLPGFDSLTSLGAHYLRYVVCFGGLNALLLGGLLALVFPTRTPPPR